MILTSTYRDQTTLSRDLLGAYSALDHVTTAALTPQALTSAFERLLQRLVVLAALHGKGVPADFLTALATTSEDVDVVDLTAAFLEHGTATMPGTTSEIQQEIVPRMSLQQCHERIPTTGSPYGVAVAVFDASSATSCPCCWPT